MLAHYDQYKPLVISCDISPYDVGGVLAQEDSRGHEVPIVFASRTLGPAEQNYTQLYREGLVVIAAQHFHKFIAFQLSVVLLLRPQRLRSKRNWCLALPAVFPGKNCPDTIR